MTYRNHRAGNIQNKQQVNKGVSPLFTCKNTPHVTMCSVSNVTGFLIVVIGEYWALHNVILIHISTWLFVGKYISSLGLSVFWAKKESPGLNGSHWMPQVFKVSILSFLQLNTYYQSYISSKYRIFYLYGKCKVSSWNVGIIIKTLLHDDTVSATTLYSTEYPGGKTRSFYYSVTYMQVFLLSEFFSFEHPSVLIFYLNPYKALFTRYLW